MSRSLLEVLRDVTLDPGEHAAFSADPAGYLAQYGYEDVPADDLAEAFSLVADTLPADVAQAVSPNALAGESPGSPDSGFGTGGGQTLTEGPAGPVLDADPDETSFGAVNNDFDDDAAGAVTDPSDATDDVGRQLGADSTDADNDEIDDVVAGSADDAGFGFGEGSALDVSGGDAGGLADMADSAGEPDATRDVVESLDDAFAHDLEGDFGPVGIEVEDQVADFGTGDADDGHDHDGDDSLTGSFDFTDPAGDIDDIGAF